MSKFEEYLLSIGYVRHSFVNRQWVPSTGPYFFSSLGDVSYQYYKTGAPTIAYGLNEAGHAPTLIHPRPVSPPMHSGPSGKLVIEGPVRDAMVHRVLTAYTPAQVYAAILENRTLAPSAPAALATV